MNPELMAYAENLLTQLLHEFPISKPPSLAWKRYRTTAGTADYITWTINLSAHVLDDKSKLDSTLRHEYAHLLAFSRYGPQRGRGHGPAWQGVMREMGQDPEVRHCYEANRNQPRQVVLYRCAKCGERINRHRRLPRNRKYVHVGCGGVIVLDAVARHTDATHAKQPA